MQYHLLHTIKPCPGCKNDIELTEDIKERILLNRIYHIPVQQTPLTFNQIINNNNTVINYIANMDTVSKITKYIEHTGVPLIDFEQSVEDKFDKKARKLESNGYRHGFSLKEIDFLEIIDEISNVHAKIEEFNIMYDPKANKMKIFEAGVWEASLVSSGIKKMIQMIQLYYLNVYECYLIRHIRSSDVVAFKKQQYTELLHVYYKFLGVFDVEPFVSDKHDNAILYNEYDDRRDDDTGEYTIQEEFLPIYNKVVGSTTKSESNSLRKSVLDIIKRNTSKNVEDMNKRLLDLFNMDPAFKESIIGPC
jgi:soluble cytochrome b562